MTEEPVRKKTRIKLWVRLVAAIMALMLVVTAILLDAAAIRLLSATGSGIENASAKYLSDNTGYMQEDEFSRIGDIISSNLRAPVTYEDYYRSASILIAQGKYEDALSAINKCADLYTGGSPDFIDELWMKKGCLKALLGDYDGALSCFAGITGSTFIKDVCLIEAQIYIERKEYGGARSCIEEYLTYFPDDSDYRVLLAEVCYKGGDFSEAAEQYTILIQSKGDADGSLHMLRGLCCEQGGDYRAAIADFKDALSLGYTDTSVCYEQCALCSYMLGEYEAVLSYGAEAIEQPSENVQLHKLYKYMGMASLALKEYDKAIASLSSAIGINADIEDAYYYRGVCYMAAGEYDKAIEDFSASIDEGSMLADCYYDRSLCYLQTGDIKKASDDLTWVENSGDTELAASAKTTIDQLKNVK